MRYSAGEDMTEPKEAEQQLAERIKNKEAFREAFRIELEIEVDRAKALETSLELLLLQPAVQQNLQQVRQALLETIRPKDLVGQLDENQFGVALPDTDILDALQIAKKITNVFPSPVALGISIFRKRMSEIDRMKDLYGASQEALSKAQKKVAKKGTSQIVAIFRPGQELSKSELPQELKNYITLIHR